MEAAVQYCGHSEGIDKQKSKQEKKELRAMQRKFRDSVNEQYASTTRTAITFLAENESVRGYQRKCLSQSFELLLGGGRHRSDIPSRVNHTWIQMLLSRRCESGHNISKSIGVKLPGNTMFLGRLGLLPY